MLHSTQRSERSHGQLDPAQPSGLTVSFVLSAKSALNAHLVNFVLKVSIILVINHLGKPDLFSSSLQHRDRWVKVW